MAHALVEQAALEPAQSPPSITATATNSTTTTTDEDLASDADTSFGSTSADGSTRATTPGTPGTKTTGAAGGAPLPTVTSATPFSFPPTGPSGPVGGGPAGLGNGVGASSPASPPNGLLPSQRKYQYHRHMARSALKRDSVVTLPSIKDLQAHFSSGGAKAEHRAGVGVGIRSSALAMLEEEEPEQRHRRPLKPWKDVHLPRVGAAEARAEAADLAAAMRARWSLAASQTVTQAQGGNADDPAQPAPSSDVSDAPASEVSVPTEAAEAASPPAAQPEDMRDVFVWTARTVRRVRLLALSLVPTGQRRISGPAQNRSAAFSTPSRPGAGARVVSGSATPPVAYPPDPSAPVRRAALDLLGHLRALEERLCEAREAVPVVVIVPEPGMSSALGLVASPTDESGGAPSVSSYPSSYPSASSGPSRATSPASYGSPNLDHRRLSMASTRSITSLDDYFSDDDEFNINAAAAEAEASRPHEPWEDRLVGEAREYRTVTPDEWVKASTPVRGAARRWIEAVERAFGERAESTAAAWVTKAAAVSSDLDRTRIFISANLTPQHQALLPEGDILQRLSDGFLLIQAYNAWLYASPRPWGFIPPEDVHDTLSTVDDNGREWTFRRVQNLTCWAASLRLRYTLPINLPASALARPALPDAPEPKPTPRVVSTSAGRRDAPRIDFDPLVVAKHSEGWEPMLRAVVSAWVVEAAREVGHTLPSTASGASTPEEGAEVSEGMAAPKAVAEPAPEGDGEQADSADTATGEAEPPAVDEGDAEATVEGSAASEATEDATAVELDTTAEPEPTTEA